MNRKQSQRFDPSGWTAKLVPVLLGLILLGLLAVLVLVGLSVLGITPGA
jgi:hypothetical protein